MPTWRFNYAATNGLPLIETINGGMGTKLAAAGNALESMVGEAKFRQVMMTPPGATWSAVRNAGIQPRTVSWDWTIVTGSESDLNSVETTIEKYLQDGREYILTDGIRSSSYAVMDAQHSRRVGRRQRLADGRWRQRWQLVFLVTKPVIGETSF